MAAGGAGAGGAGVSPRAQAVSPRITVTRLGHRQTGLQAAQEMWEEHPCPHQPFSFPQLFFQILAFPRMWGRKGGREKGEEGVSQLDQSLG